MFKRVQNKRRRQEEEEELGLDQDTREAMGLNSTDSDESDSDSEHDGAQSEDSGTDVGVGEDGDQDDDATSWAQSVDEDPPISVTEALKDPIYLVSLDPTIYGCVLCKGRLIKSPGMGIAHKNASAHRRRFERFRLLSAGADPRGNAWELVRTIRSASNVQRVEPQALSKRALKRQVKQVAIHEKRKRHKELKAKAAARKALKKDSTVNETNVAASCGVNLRNSPILQDQSKKPRKTQNLPSKTPFSMTVGTRDATARPASHAKGMASPVGDSKKSRLRSKRKANKLS